MTSENQENSVSCPDCGSSLISEVSRAEEFHYGLGDESVTLSAVVPIIHCDSCGFEFTDHRAEEARHESVCRHLGVLTPKEIVGIRDSIGLTRTEFAALGGFGIASLQRWETGALVQNPANDRLIYLLQFTANRQRLTKKLEPPPMAIALSAESASRSEVEYCRASEFPFRTISTAVLASDESLMRTAGIFAEMMNEGCIFSTSR